MQLIFYCSSQEETVQPETLCSDCCSVEQDTSDTLFANRSVSAVQLHIFQFLCSYLRKYSSFLTHDSKPFLSLRHITG